MGEINIRICIYEPISPINNNRQQGYIEHHNQFKYILSVYVILISSDIGNMQNQFLIKNASLDQVKMIIDNWVQEEGWMPGLNDAYNFYQADPSGFFVGYLGQQLIASVSALKYVSDHGFIGLFIVKPEHRKKGYGSKIFNHAMEYLGNRNIGLDGVLKQVHYYEKNGFKSYHLVSCYSLSGLNQSQDEEGIVLLKQYELKEICQYSESCILTYDQEFMKKWINQDGFSIGYIENGHLGGYAVLRPTKTAFKIGPLLADTPQIARKLLTKIRKEVGCQGNVLISAWSPNKHIMEIINDYKGELISHCMRMYTRQLPQSLSNQRIYGLLSSQIG